MANMRRRMTSRGQAMVEFALVLPLFLLVIFAVLDLGRAIYDYSTITNAAREAARFGIIAPSPTASVQAKVQQFAGPLGIATADITVSCLTADGTNLCANAQAGDEITVAVTYPYTPLVQAITTFTGPTLTLATSATMVVQ